MANSKTKATFWVTPPKGDSLRASEPRVQEILRRLKIAYPGATCTLHFKNPLQLLVATILSAQCTDERVNRVTPKLFERYPTVQDFANADREELEKHIRSTGFYRQKARSIRQSARLIVEKFDGKVPDRLEDLVQLPGVGRKTANVVLGNAFGRQDGVVVDTHVGRLARRLGLTTENSPEKVEKDLMAHIPRHEWTLFSHLLIQHGRAVCTARNPDCGACFLRELCFFAARKNGSESAKTIS